VASKATAETTRATNGVASCLRSGAEAVQGERED